MFFGCGRLFNRSHFGTHSGVTHSLIQLYNIYRNLFEAVFSGLCLYVCFLWCWWVLFAKDSDALLCVILRTPLTFGLVT